MQLSVMSVTRWLSNNAMEPTAAPKARIAPASSAAVAVLCVGRPGAPGGGGSSPDVRRRETSDARETGVARRGVRPMGRPTVSGPEGPDVKGQGADLGSGDG